MIDTVRQALRELILQFGQSLCDEPKRCKGLLHDRCPEHRREVFLLVSALEEQVVADLREGLSGQARDVVFGRLSRRLEEHRGLAEQHARWAVESWAFALGIIEEARPRGKRRIGLRPAPSPPVAVPPVASPSVSSIPFKLILAGEFWMGSTDEDRQARRDERPRHRVRISRPFFLGVTPVTQSQYARVIGQNPSHFRERPDNPVESVSWLEAVSFCNELSRKEGLAPYYLIRQNQVDKAGGSGYRLPTEAEWEYACRAGAEGRYCFGDDVTVLGEYTWFAENSDGQSRLVGQKRPNAWGLFDMHGNVWEWCADAYDENYYQSSPTVNPPGGAWDGYRVIRGGSWSNRSHSVRAAYRYGLGPGFRSSSLGFRVAREKV